DTVAALGHDYTATITEPTCTDGGYTTYTCSRCGNAYTDNYTDALGHAWDDGVITTTPTADAQGEITYTCTVCGATRTAPVSYAVAAAPTTEPTAAPTAEPTAAPTAEPTAAPTAAPTAVPTAEPTAEPTPSSTPEPAATAEVPDPTIAATIIIGDAAGTETPAETGESGASPALLIGVILVIVGCGVAAIGIVIWSRRRRR
ncbi:MAG: PT domain-containing protein, partial [Oscillospiraceae bacterium]|nr:PT domain-containing protein [Oscillospiraceae bacterium]